MFFNRQISLNQLMNDRHVGDITKLGKILDVFFFRNFKIQIFGKKLAIFYLKITKLKI